MCSRRPILRDMALGAFLFGLGGLILICFGSFLAAAVPGDGQTGMIVFPLWFVGGWLGLVAINRVLTEPEAYGLRLVVVGFAILAALSVVLAYFVGRAHVRRVRDEDIPPRD
jgi:hypothetical protein